VARTTSAGRLFDAIAALAGIRSVATYEGQAAIELEAAAAGGVAIVGEPGVDLIEADTGLVLDPGPLLARLLALRAEGGTAADIGATFHDGLASGGVFQNVRLTTLVHDGLQRLGLRVLVHRTIPPNDGGIALGQAAVASARRAN
jgi:hydrogenase maturation protein HypF